MSEITMQPALHPWKVSIKPCIAARCVSGTNDGVYAPEQRWILLSNVVWTAIT